jgi:L-aminopeptidase/D-esterase-like protein
MARAIYPFHTNNDGDILFAATTNEVENPNINELVLSHIASELAWDAVLCSFESHET